MAPPNSTPPPPDFIAAAASRIYHGAPARQPDLTAAAEKVTAARLRGLGRRGMYIGGSLRPWLYRGIDALASHTGTM